MTKCPVCKHETATVDPSLGILPCLACQTRRRGLGVNRAVEFTSEAIKEDRKKFAGDILQPFRAGELSKEYIEHFGTKGISVSKDEVKKAVPTTDSYYG
jgi:hypothetical protein